MYADGEGRPSHPPSLMAGILLLQRHADVSDREATERLQFDLRWQYALRLPMDIGEIGGALCFEGSSGESPRRKCLQPVRPNSLRLPPVFMIARVWRGWTRPEHADPYETLLRTEILPGIADQDPEGFLGGEVLRRELDGEVEFMTILRFESREGIRQFAGEPIEEAHIPDPARALLHRHEDRARHYESRDQAALPDR